MEAYILSASYTSALIYIYIPVGDSVFGAIVPSLFMWYIKEIKTSNYRFII